MAKTCFFGVLLTVMAMMFHVDGWAAGMEILTAPPEDPVSGGDSVVLRLYLHNNTDADMVTTLPVQASCHVEGTTIQKTVQAELVGGDAEASVEIPANGFSRRQYRIVLPGYAEGAVRLHLAGLNTNDLTLSVQKAPPEVWGGAQIPLDEGSILVHSFLQNFSVYEPTYFLLGVEPGIEKSKFQFSFKYRLFSSEGRLSELFPPLSHFYLAYTQRSFWDLKDSSKPFEDTSYMPQIFYEIPMIDVNVDRISALGVRLGFMHESNGKGGDDSRSTNYLYIEPIMAVHLAGDYYIKIAPRIYTYVNNEDHDNGDLDAYRGYFVLNTTLADPEGLALESHFRWADKGPSVQLDLTYPMTRILPGSLNLYLHAQYFSGYGETLLHYNERDDVIRLGFALVR
ncbi:phospholipase A [Desulfosarcina sp. OttesenSCG-928-G10]|nr:phospholipase A [Desulfosarcina sp. OttesenSCG-928-G10]MDL2320896.1 phospholipase A [Desulfosarcina sp. OttesenSCG-928-B08]